MLHVRKRKIHLHRNLLHKTSDIPQHRPGYDHLRELIQYERRSRLQEESLEDPTWKTFECIVNGPEALGWLDAHRPEVAAKIREAS